MYPTTGSRFCLTILSLSVLTFFQQTPAHCSSIASLFSRYSNTHTEEPVPEFPTPPSQDHPRYSDEILRLHGAFCTFQSKNETQAALHTAETLFRLLGFEENSRLFTSKATLKTMRDSLEEKALRCLPPLSPQLPSAMRGPLLQPDAFFEIPNSARLSLSSGSSSPPQSQTPRERIHPRINSIKKEGSYTPEFPRRSLPSPQHFTPPTGIRRIGSQPDVKKPRAKSDTDRPFMNLHSPQTSSPDSSGRNTPTQPEPLGLTENRNSIFPIWIPGQSKNFVWKPVQNRVIWLETIGRNTPLSEVFPRHVDLHNVGEALSNQVASLQGKASSSRFKPIHSFFGFEVYEATRSFDTHMRENYVYACIQGAKAFGILAYLFQRDPSISREYAKKAIYLWETYEHFGNFASYDYGWFIQHLMSSLYYSLALNASNPLEQAYGFKRALGFGHKEAYNQLEKIKRDIPSEFLEDVPFAEPDNIGFNDLFVLE